MIDELLEKLYGYLCGLYNKIIGIKDISILLIKVVSLKEWEFGEHEFIPVTDDVAKLITDKINLQKGSLSLPRVIVIRDYTTDLLRLYPNSNYYRRRTVFMFTEDGLRNSFNGRWGVNTLYEDLEYAFRNSSDTARDILGLVNKLSYMIIEYECDQHNNDRYGTKYVFYKVSPEAKEELVKMAEKWVEAEDKENAEKERKENLKEQHKNEMLRKLKED